MISAEELKQRLVSLTKLQEAIQAFDFLGRLNAIENWRDTYADPNFESLINNLQYAVKQIQDQQTTLSNQQKVLTKTTSDISDALQIANNAVGSAREALTRATDAYNTAATAWNAEISLFKKAFQSISTNMTGFANAVTTMAKWLGDVGGVMYARVQTVIQYSGAHAQWWSFGIPILDTPIQLVAAIVNFVSYCRDVFQTFPAYWNTIKQSGTDLSTSFADLYNSIKDTNEIARL